MKTTLLAAPAARAHIRTTHIWAAHIRAAHIPPHRRHR
jgi:hypothetical protein